MQPNALALDDVIAAGLSLVREEGMDSLNVAGVARRLGVSPPAVYHYVASRDDLIRRLCEQVTREVSIPEDRSQEWDDRIVAIVLSMDATFSRYPGVAERVLPYRRRSRAASRLATEAHQCLLDGGFSDDDADELHAALHFLVGGWLLGQRPEFAEGLLRPAVLERSTRWLLDGAAARCSRN